MTYLSRRVSRSYVVGYYRKGKWQQESEHWSSAVAADRVVYLNGGETEWRRA